MSDTEQSPDAGELAEDRPNLDFYAMMSAGQERQQLEEQHRYIVQNSVGDIANRLRRAQRAISSTDTFEPGDLVQWKDFLRAAQYPLYGRPAVVVSQDRDLALQPADPNGLTPFPADLVVGYMDFDGDFVLMGTTSRRWQRWDESGA